MSQPYDGERGQQQRRQAPTVSEAIVAAEQPPADRTPAQLVEAYRKQLADVLPDHLPVETFSRLANAVLTKTPDVKEAAQRNPWSFVHALLDCARLGHEPGSKDYAFTKFNDKDAPGGMTVVGMEQYQGQMKRMYMSGLVESIHADVVYRFEMPGFARDGIAPFRYASTMEVPVHEPDILHQEYGRQESAVAVYAYARLRGGGVSKVIVMPRALVMAAREKARTKFVWDGPFWTSMWLKTAIHQLEKWVPVSSEWRQLEATRDAALATAQDALPIAAAPHFTEE